MTTDDVRVLGAHEFLALEPEPGPDPALRTCHRDSCTNTIRPPWRRPAGITHDYHAAKCIPPWLAGEPGATTYAAPRPLDTWIRSGATATASAPVAPPLPSTLPRFHQSCADCGDPVHVVHLAADRCPDCVITAVYARTEQDDPPAPEKTAAATP